MAGVYVHLATVLLGTRDTYDRDHTPRRVDVDQKGFGVAEKSRELIIKPLYLPSRVREEDRVVRIYSATLIG